MIVLRTVWRRNCKRAKRSTSNLPVLNRTISVKAEITAAKCLTGCINWASSFQSIRMRMAKALKKISNGIKKKAEKGIIMSLLDRVLTDQEVCHAKRTENPQLCSVYQFLVLRVKTSLLPKACLLMERQSHKSCLGPTLFPVDFWVCGCLNNNMVSIFFSRQLALPLECGK